MSINKHLSKTFILFISLSLIMLSSASYAGKGSPSDNHCGNSVIEYHLGEECDDGNLINGDGCSDKCLLEQETNPPERNVPVLPFPTEDEDPCEFSCTDTDSGSNPTTSRGTVYGTYTSGVSFSYSDDCSDDGMQVKEFTCTEDDFIYEYVDCPYGTVCMDGACKSGDAADDFSLDDTSTPIPDFDDGEATDGEGESVSDYSGYHVFSCTDTDGGSNPPRIKGHVFGTYVSGITFSDADSCSYDGVAVMETFCTEEGYVWTRTDCPEDTICEDGSCVPGEMEDFACTDTDSGENPPESKGTISGNYVSGIEFSQDDICNSDGLSVVEYSCTETGFELESVDCPEDTVCEFGACVPCDC